MDEREKIFYNSCRNFKDYCSIEEYIDDVKQCLILGIYKYSEKDAEALIEEQMRFIKKAYDNRESAVRTALGIGYGCG